MEGGHQIALTITETEAYEGSTTLLVIHQKAGPPERRLCLDSDARQEGSKS